MSNIAKITRISESDLVLPTLRALLKNKKTGLTTAELQPILRNALRPSGDDLILLMGRADDRFSQKVRNLRAHKRLERDSLATFKGGKYFITDAGKELIKKFSGVDESYNIQGFSEAAISQVMKPETSVAFIEEGQQTSVSRKIRKRSRKLRDYAINHFKNADGTIRCEGCDFEATEKYGKQTIGLIEIHHKKPIALSSPKVTQLAEAATDLSPLCPTCHRVVHSKTEGLMSIAELQKLIGK